MPSIASLRRALPFLTVWLLLVLPLPAAEVRVAGFNVENWFLEAIGTRPAKSAESRAKVVEQLKAINADVLGVVEMGDPASFDAFRTALKSAGLDYPHYEFVRGWDTNIHVVILSKFPFTARRSHTNENYLLGGRRLSMSRGIGDVEVTTPDGYKFTVLLVHLKSRREVGTADQAEMRLEEGKILRRIIDERLAANPRENLVVLGDFNDVYDSPAVKAILGRGANQLVDTRPAERNGDNLPNSNPRWFPRNVTWTHYYGKEDTYSRIDYIMLSPGMSRESLSDGTYIFTMPNWGLASDHRPVVATFTTQDK
jgi:endonuclease/exonuclease/phosphatase family metal-dependent hydrolase